MGDDFQQQEISVSELFTYSMQLIRCRVHLLQVAENVAIESDRTYIATGFDHLINECRNLAPAHYSTLTCFQVRSVPAKIDGKYRSVRRAISRLSVEPGLSTYLVSE